MADREWIIKGLFSERVEGAMLRLEVRVLGETDAVHGRLLENDVALRKLAVDVEGVAVDRVREILKGEGGE